MKTNNGETKSEYIVEERGDKEVHHLFICFLFSPFPFFPLSLLGFCKGFFLFVF